MLVSLRVLCTDGYTTSLLPYSGWLRQPRTIIADSEFSGAGRGWNVHYVINLSARATLDDIIA